MNPTCSLRCSWPATHTVDANQPPYAGPRVLCREHMLAAVEDVRPGQRLVITALTNTPEENQ